MSWGEIYNTSWWGVAIDTARTVKARPDFFGSQLNLLTSEQPNLVVNGDFATDSIWSKTNATISNGKAIISVPNGAYSTIAQGISYTSGKIYKLFVQVKGLNGSSGKEIRIQDNSSNAGGLGVQNATITLDETLQTLEVYWTANSSSNVITVSRSTNTGDYSFEVDNISVQVARAELDQIEAKKCLADWIHTTALKDLNN